MFQAENKECNYNLNLVKYNDIKKNFKTKSNK